MSEGTAKPKVGTLYHFDLTVPNADEVRDFYAAVVGWVAEPLSMGDYDDYVMKAADGETWVSGVCHKRGENANLPSQWLLYITVADLEASLAACVERGGSQISDIKGEVGGDRYVIIQDPAGAFMALSQPGTSGS